MKYVLGVVIFMFMFSSIVISQTDTSLSSTKTPEAMIWGGLSIPYLPLEYRTYWKGGYNVGGGFGFSLEPGEVGYGMLFATIEYGRTNFDAKKYNDSLKVLYPSDTAIGGPTKLLNIMLNFKGSFSSTKKTVAPYFLIGIGFMYYTVAEISVIPDNSLTIVGVNKGAFSWSAGVGVEVPVTESVKAFVQAKSLLGVSNPTRQYFPITFGLSYTM